MRTRVKICGITREADGVAAANAGADAIGLVFWSGTPRCVSPDLARQIANSIPPFVSIVGLFVDPAPHEVQSVLKCVPLDVLQFHGTEPPQLCASFGRPYIKAVPVRPGVDLLQYAAQYEDARGLLFDAFEPGGLPGGTGTTFDWRSLPRGLRRPLLLSGGLNAQNVAAAIRTAAPWAVDVSSGVEVTGEDGRPRRGLKDPTKMAAFIREVHDADVRSS